MGTSTGATATPGAAGTSSPGAAPAVSPLPGVPGGADTKTVCAAYNKVQGDVGAKFLTLVQKLPEAIADPAKAGPAMTELKAALKDYQSGLTNEVARAADGELRTAIQADVTTIAKATAEIEAAGNDVAKALAALNTPEFQKLGERVKALCDK